jgi:hypothetical protein
MIKFLLKLINVMPLIIKLIELIIKFFRRDKNESK